MERIIINNYPEFKDSIRATYGTRLKSGAISYVQGDNPFHPFIIELLNGGEYYYWISSSKRLRDVPWMFVGSNYSGQDGIVRFFNKIQSSGMMPIYPSSKETIDEISLVEFSSAATEQVKTLLTKEILFRI